MKAVISRWGNSLGLRIPKAAAESLGLKDGDPVTIAEENGSLRITPAGRIDISAMVAEMRPETFHEDPWEDAAPVGDEIW